MKKIQPAIYGNEPRHFKREGNSPDHIAEWEDGFRTSGVKNAFEWWYFDAHLNDGSSLIMMFYSKTVFDANGPIKPQATFELSTPDGKKIEKIRYAGEGDYSFSTKTCDVRIGPCTFKGNLKEYHIHYEIDDIKADVKLVGRVPAWRQSNAYDYFGDKEDLYFAWLPSVPDGDVEAEITIAGVKKNYTGTGYHDYNWGNVNMASILHHWYWGRAKVGNYNIITANVISGKQYGYAPLCTFLLAENNEIVVGSSDMYKYVTFSGTKQFTDPVTGKPVLNDIIFDYDDGQKHYRVTYIRKNDISKYKMKDSMPGFTRFLLTLAGFDGAYHRFVGEVSVEKIVDGKVVEKVTEPSGVWELMYFGKNKPDFNY